MKPLSEHVADLEQENAKLKRTLESDTHPVLLKLEIATLEGVAEYFWRYAKDHGVLIPPRTPTDGKYITKYEEDDAISREGVSNEKALGVPSQDS